MLNASTAEEVVRIVTTGWHTCEHEDELIARVMTVGLTREQAEDAILMVQHGYSRATITDLGVQASSNFDDDPVFRAALNAARRALANAPKPEPRSIEQLAAELQSEDLLMRQRAIWGLREATDRRVIPLLLPLLSDPDRVIRIDALVALSAHKSTEAVPRLCEMLKEESDYLSLGAIIGALEQAGDPVAVPHIIEMTKHADCYVRYYAAQSLGRMKDQRAVPALEALLADQNPVEKKDDQYGLMLSSLGCRVCDEARSALRRVRKANKRWWFT